MLDWSIAVLAVLAVLFIAMRAARVRGPVDWGWLGIACFVAAAGLPAIVQV